MEASIPAADPRLFELIEDLGVEAGSLAYVEQVRWPGGVVCPRCSSDRVGYLEARAKYNCRDCAYQFRVTAGTVLHDSHLPVSGWLLAVGLMLGSELGFPALQLQCAIGGSYKTAWFVGHRVRAAMSQALVGRDEDAELPPASSVSDGWAEMRGLAVGAYHRPSLDHIGAYWGEALWRRRCVDDVEAFRRTVGALLEAGPLPYAQLVGRTRPVVRPGHSAHAA